MFALCVVVFIVSFAFFLRALGVALIPLIKAARQLTPDLKNQHGIQILGSSAKYYGILSRLHCIGNDQPEYK